MKVNVDPKRLLLALVAGLFLLPGLALAAGGTGETMNLISHPLGITALVIFVAAYSLVIMEETLHSLPLVLDEPPPQVFFLGFGDSSLNFRLHAFSRQLSDRLPLMHAIHGAILKALRENNIEIPFPQRDLHIRSTVEKD